MDELDEEEAKETEAINKQHNFNNALTRSTSDGIQQQAIYRKKVRGRFQLNLTLQSSISNSYCRTSPSSHPHPSPQALSPSARSLSPGPPPKA